MKGLSLVVFVSLCMASPLSLLAQSQPASAQSAPAPQSAPAQQPATGAQMTVKQVAERLNIVPVFTVVSKDGVPILANVEKDGKKIQVANFWLDKAQADKAIEQIKAANPDIAAQAKVFPMSLGYAYEIAENKNEETKDVLFQVLPRPVDTQSALAILKKNGEANVTEFPGIPLFYGTSEGKGLLTIEKDGVEIVPFFFSQQDLEDTLKRAAAANPEVSKATKIEVTTLDQVVGSMIDKEAKADVQKIGFIPARQALQEAQSLAPMTQPPQGGANSPANPAPKK
jgi:hypothetical protein